MSSETADFFPVQKVSDYQEVQGGLLAPSGMYPDLLLRYYTHDDNGTTYARAQELLERQEEAINDMAEAGIAVPMPFFRGFVARHPRIKRSMVPCLVVDKVIGIELRTDMDLLPGAVDDAMDSALRLLERTVTRGGSYIPDLHIGQFMLGIVSYDLNPRNYFVDLDSRVAHFDIQNPTVRDFDNLVFDLAILHRDVERIERTRGSIERGFRDQIQAIAGRIPFSNFGLFLTYLQAEDAGMNFGPGKSIPGYPLDNKTIIDPAAFVGYSPSLGQPEGQ